MGEKGDAAAPPAPGLKRGRGRPRSAAVEEKILRAALDALAEDGFPGLSVDRICARAGVPRGTFYRRWSTPIEAVLDALTHFTGDIALEDTGDLAGDLLVYMKKLIAMHADPIMGVCRAFMATEARVRPDVTAVMVRSAREKLERDRDRLAAAMRRQGFNGPLHADLVLNAVHGVAINTVAHWRVSDDEMRTFIATLLGGAPDRGAGRRSPGD
jgi:AcrR family transcriptional regulator